MSSHFVKVHVPPPVAEPRGARWVGALANAAGAAARAWLRMRQRQATPPAPRNENDLLALARRMEHDRPGLAVELRAIAMHQVKPS